MASSLGPTSSITYPVESPSPPEVGIFALFYVVVAQVIEPLQEPLAPFVPRSRWCRTGFANTRHLVTRTPFVGCSQNSLSCRNRASIEECPQIKRGSTHSRSEALWSVAELPRLVQQVSVGSLSASSQPGGAPVRNQIRHDQCGREEDQTEEEVQEEAVTLATSNTSWPEGDGDPDDEGQRPPQPETTRCDHCGTSPYRSTPRSSGAITPAASHIWHEILVRLTPLTPRRRRREPLGRSGPSRSDRSTSRRRTPSSSGLSSGRRRSRSPRP